MSFRNRIDVLSVIWGLSLIAGGVARGASGDINDSSNKWRDLGTLLLCRSGVGQCPPVQWLDRQWTFVAADSGQAISVAQAVVKNAWDGYAQDEIAIRERVPLDVNPQCLLGLYIARRFPGTRLGDWGWSQFERSIEQACLMAMARTDGTWSDRLTAELLTSDAEPQGSSRKEPFALSEEPYLYLYLLHHARSRENQNKAREQLARCLWQGYGLEPGLEQYLVLFDQGYGATDTWLEVAAELERTGARTRAKKVYEKVMKNADSAELTRPAFEGLAHILLPESREGDIRTAWETVSRRFPSATCASPDVKELLSESEASRAQRGKQFIDELARTTNQLRALQLCRLFDALWTPEETLSQWQMIVDRAEPGTLVEQLGRVFLARAMLDRGKADAAETFVRGLAESTRPCVQAQGIAILAEIARARGNLAESARLYARAMQIDRPTALPSWCPGFLRVHCSGEGMPASGLQAQMLFLEGCNSLIDGDYTAAVNALCPVAADPEALPDPLRSTLSLVMMLAYLGSEDYVEADAWGYRVLEEWSRNNPEDAEVREHMAKVQSLNNAAGQLTTKVRMGTTSTPGGSSVPLPDAKSLCKAVAALDSVGTSGEGTGGVRQLHTRTKRLHLARVLTAEYRYTRQQQMECEAKEPLSAVESLLFAAQLIGEDSFDRVTENLSLACDAKEMGHVMYRFAAFAQETGRPDLARRALDTAASGLSSTGNADLLEDIASMYLVASSHQKAIEVYKQVAAGTKDIGRIQNVLRKIIDVYAEDLKDYDKAIQQCEEFIRKYPEGPRVREVEFLIGKYAYLRKDYSGSVGQLDGFRKRWPEDPLVGQAMLLAGLARMAEGNNPDAISRFTEIVRRYPDGELAARGKFLIGYSQVSSQQYQAALETFKQLIEQFPQSQYTSQAQSLIDRLSKVAK